jgi:phospholipid-binding lipoprotein MlaA
MIVKQALRALLLFSFCVSCSVFAQPPSDDFDDEDYDDEVAPLIADPLEPFNRAMFAFNDKLYFYALKPVARAYRHVPEGARVSVSNFFKNLRSPIRMANALLQLKLVDAGNELLRFGINTTIGIGGLFDPARKYLGIREIDEDLGQTLGHYGVGQGLYLVLPIFGSTSVRDGIGSTVDYYYLDPAFTAVDDDWTKVGLYALDSVNEVSLDRDTYEAIKRDQLDPYSFVRDAYAQNRQARVSR